MMLNKSCLKCINQSLYKVIQYLKDKRYKVFLQKCLIKQSVIEIIQLRRFVT